MKNKSNLPPQLQQQVECFFEYAPPQRLSRNLRKLLTGYLGMRQDGHDMNIEDLILDMEWLFGLLDVAEDELKPG